MILETDILPYLVWLPDALQAFAVTAIIVALIGLVLGYLVAAVRHGPMAAGDMTYRTLVAAGADLARISPRRMYAIARLAVQESIRRRVWVVFVLFALILLFAGWFLHPNTEDPAELYLTFVFWATNYLLLFLALFLSTFSLPNEIKNRIIYTVVTKPVRSGEIVFGRMLGFTAVGTVMLLVMGVVSYFFVTRSLRHTHEIPPESIKRSGEIGMTTIEQNHQHEFQLVPGGDNWTEFRHGHRHQIIEDEDASGQPVYRVGPREDLEIARVPQLGDFYIIERDGQPGRGVSVGQEWGYRRFIEGNSPMAAVWTFHNVTEENFPNDGILIERTLRIFRTHKGVLGKGISGNIYFRNPDTGTQSTQTMFTAKEFVVDSQWFDRQMESDDRDRRREIDLFRDLVTEDGRLEVWIQCIDSGQYFGAARADLYLRAENAPFGWNFVKGYFGIWFQMVLVIAFGVMFSTFLSGPVAMLATVGTLILGLFTSSFIFPLANAVINEDIKLMAGGGPIESTIRLVTQVGIMTPLEDSAGIRIAKLVDKALMYGLRSLASLLPDFSRFDDGRFVASGYDVPPDLVAQQASITAAFVLATFMAGFLFMRMREVAK